MTKPFSFSRLLINWYRKNARDLPWRKTRDPYKIWVSEVMLQQTTVNAVIPYYKRWVKEFPNIKAIARASLQKILKQWQGLGYYQRAKNIKAAAQEIALCHAGKIPQDVSILRKLPGFGPYTVGAVLSIAFDQRQPIIDANVRRVVMRLLALEGHADTRQDKAILKFLDQTMPRKNMSLFNQGLMELGALVCRNKEPLCNLCPVKSLCRAYKQGVQEIIPAPKKKSIKDIHAVIALIQRNGSYFIQRRPNKGLLADLWEFPGGKIKPGESPQRALARELREELKVDLQSAKHVMNVRHFYTQFRVNLQVYSCRLKTWPGVDKAHKWSPRNRLHHFPMPSGSAKILDRLP